MAFGGIAIAYTLFVLWLYFGWRKTIAQTNRTPYGKEYTFSVVVPVRNEAQNIQNLLLDISIQGYSNKLFDVIVVDDHSTDDTIQQIEALELPYSISVLTNPKSGKKEALAYGISKAKNEIILTTDGDCRVQKSWVQSFVNSYTDDSVKLVFGAVTFHDEKTWFEKLQTIEFASLVGSGFATLGNGYASMCNAANFSFRKSDFEDVNGYADHLDIPSGDDEFLMHRIFKGDKGAVKVNSSARGVVYTKAASTFSEFMNQRKRWASKWGSYSLVFPKVLAVIVFLFTLSFGASIVFYLLGKLHLNQFILLISTKLCLDFIFIKTVMNHLKKELNIGLYFLLSFVYLLYVPLFGILGSFGKYSWKGRSH